jgi:hypothetical protein
MKKGMIITAIVVAVGLSVPTETYAKNLNSNRDILAQQDEVKYDKIDVAELPEAVSAAITQDYAGYEISKASLGDDGTYKVKLKSDDEKTTVIYNAGGEFVKTEEDGGDDSDSGGGLFENDDSDSGDTIDTQEPSTF